MSGFYVQQRPVRVVQRAANYARVWGKWQWERETIGLYLGASSMFRQYYCFDFSPIYQACSPDFAAF